MKALLLEEYGKPMEVKEVPEPQLTDDGVIIEVKASGICRSDWHVWKGERGVLKRLPHVLGHEFTGVIAETGRNVRRFKKGDRVIVPVSHADNTCPYCREGFQNLCENRFIPGLNDWGGFAEYVHIPNADGNLIFLPETMDFVTAASLGCRFVTAFHGLVDQVKVRAGEWVAVYGCGGVGLSAVQIASAIGARVIAVDIGDDKLELARSVGALHTVNAKDVNPVEAVMEITKGGVDVSVDALGIKDTCQNAILSLAKRGRHLQIGLTTKAESGFVPVPMDMIVGKEAQIIGSAGIPVSRYPAMFRLIESVRIQPEKLVTQRIPLEEASRVFVQMSQYANTGISVVDRF